jgi:hypothetical protein
MRTGKGESVTLARDGGSLEVVGVSGRTFALAAEQQLQGGLTTRQADDEPGVDILGTDSGNPGVGIYGPDGLLQMALSADVAGGIFQFWTGHADETGPGYINPISAGLAGPGVDIGSPQTTDGRSRVTLFPENVDIHAPTLNASGDVSALGNISAEGNLQTVTPPSTTSPVNCRIGAAGILNIVTSLARNKLDLQEIPLEDALALLKVTPRTWFDRAEVEANDGSTEGLRRVPGALAEDVERHVPELATYNEDGELQGIAYERIPAYLIPTVKHIHDENIDLRARVERLEEAVTRLLGKDGA